ncbi:MAG: SulP family inorganic anion transporter [Thalassospira sp.]|uniref:SulP family inorganic anion transporter n=1 Tax=Thalassospira sp. TaxID=1912094 RepID=UPI001B1CEC51|nr:SulP family inorganic anion transporter [Thalassospira sp.]MBO6578423.1 SulP family inorganic anion transporter [Thalassospira sp.]MBO6818879.1 SulP family inorganic anion transporter [Thalassospira sp.]MBO6888657.1 SulP family inorganic anion transporter [Thalassospira sp.]
MKPENPEKSRYPKPDFVELFTPKLITVLSEGYGLAQLRADAIAGLTVAIVALPLSMAIAIASGATPAQGLYTAIIGGILVSLLGGSRFQIGGPAGAFIVLVAATVQAHGMDGLLLATIMAGVLLVLIGLFRLGTYIKFIPYPVTVGFTAGIAFIIFASQIKDLLGLDLGGPEPGPFLEKLPVIWAALPSMDLATVMLSGSTILVIVGLKYVRPHWPGMLIAVVGAALITAVFDLPVATIGSIYGGIPSSFPMPSLPDLDFAKAQAVLPNAIAFALLGAIESLLSAVVADGMTGRRHRSNCELVAQGVANVASGLFGGICVTGTIARTATNVRSKAHGPIAGILHGVFLLLFILIAAPLAGFIPLACLAGLLATVAWNMIEKHAIVTLLRSSRGDAAVLLTTLLLTVFRDLLEAIVVGFALGSVLFIRRMSRMADIESATPFVAEDRADNQVVLMASDPVSAGDPDIVVYRISGVFFFGATAAFGSVLDRIGDTRRALVVDFSAVPFLDSTAANTLASLVQKVRSRGGLIVFSGTKHDIRRDLFVHGMKPPAIHYEVDVEQAVKWLGEKLGTLRD